MANNILDLLNKIKAVSNKFEKYNEDQFRRGFFSDEISAKKLYNTLNTNKKNDSKWNIIPTITSLDLFLKTYVCNDDQITWKSNCSACIQLNPPNTTVKLEDYTGLFKSNVAKDGLFLISIDNDGTTESLVIKSYQLPIEFGEATLISTNQKNLFTLGSPKITEYVNKLPLLTDVAKNSILTKLTVKFADDLNSFDYDVYITKGTATRSGEKIKNVEKNKNDNTDDQKKPEKKFEPDYKKSVLKFDNNKNYTDNTPSKDCNSFPFTLGCVNTKIGDLNAVLFNGDRMGDKFNETLENSLDNTGWINKYKNPNSEITQELWDKLMKQMRMNEVVKNTVKKVLKEYIIKK